jgi:hypothetical protein
VWAAVGESRAAAAAERVVGESGVAADGERVWGAAVAERFWAAVAESSPPKHACAGRRRRGS